MPGDGTTPDGPYCLAILHVKRFRDGLQDPIIAMDAGSGVCNDCGRWHANGLPGMGWLRPVKGKFSVNGRKDEHTGPASERGTALYLAEGGVGWEVALPPMGRMMYPTIGRDQVDEDRGAAEREV